MSEEEKKAKIELLNIPRLSVKRQNARDIILKAIDKKDKEIEKLQKENTELKYKLEGKDCWIDTLEHNEDVIEEALKKQDKVIYLMATELSRRPLVIYLDNERDDRLVILDNPKEIIKYYTKKAEEEK